MAKSADTILLSPNSCSIGTTTNGHGVEKAMLNVDVSSSNPYESQQPSAFHSPVVLKISCAGKETENLG